MHDPRESRVRSGGALRACLVVISSALAVGCGGPTVFSGNASFAVNGTPPPAPPPKPPAKAELKQDRIEIKEKIQFRKDEAVIEAVSHALLNEVADILKKHPEVKKLAIEGHASAEGGDQYNLVLSDKRSEAVMNYIVKQGVAGERLSAKGFGEERPVAENESEEGREKNRRVEFNIVERADAPPNAAAAVTK